MSTYERFDDPYCYLNSPVLKNRAGIKSSESLELFEVRATMLRASEPLPTGKFGPAHYRAIHPFREGNGRTQLTFLFLLGHRAGIALDMTRIRPQEMLAAMIASFDGKLEGLEVEIGWLVVDVY